MKSDNEMLLSDKSLKPRRLKTREVSSRFLSPTSSSSSLDIGGMPSPNQAGSPLRLKFTSRKHQQQRSPEDSGFIRGLWPSSSPSNKHSTSSSSPKNKNLGTLADHLGSERLQEYAERQKEKKKSFPGDHNVFSLSRQRSCTVISRFENGKQSAKENHRPVLGGSMRYTGKLRFPGKSSSSSSSSSSSYNSGIIPGRLSVDENALYRKSSRQRLDTSAENLDRSESDCSDVLSGRDSGSPSVSKSVTSSTRKPGIEVSSKYLKDVSTKLKRGTSDSNILHPVSSDSSPKFHKLTIKNAIKRANSLTGYGSATSQWALSPGRSASPPVSVESKTRPMSFSSLKPPSSPSKVKGVEKLLNFGLDLFKSKKSSSVAMVFSNVESVHQLRLLHNRLMQWRFANAKAETVKRTITNQVQNNLSCALDSLAKLQHSVLLKKLQLQKEKLEMKLDFILWPQMKLLENWEDMEMQHLSAVSKTTECLHSVICRVPLIEGAKVDPQSTYMVLRQASDLTSSMKAMFTDLSSTAEQTGLLLLKLAEVVAQEKILLEEGLELLRMISMLEIQEQSLTSYIIQLQQKQQ